MVTPGHTWPHEHVFKYIMVN